MGEVRVLVDPKALRRAKDRLRALTSRRWGISMERRIDEINRFTVGWTAYFRLADTPTPLEDLDEWLRRRLRQVRWKEWKRVRTRRRKLRALGISETNARQWATSRKGYWRIAGSKVLAVARPTAAGPTSACRDSSVPTAASGMPSEPPDADPHGRWCGGRGGEPGAYPIEVVVPCRARRSKFPRSQV
jgi:Group II intron, maturase-specific domain